jgi:hypothetical protein
MHHSNRSRSYHKFVAALFASLILTLMPALSQTATNIAFLGTNNPAPFPSFELDDVFTSAPLSQGATSLTLNVPFSGGQSVFGAFGSLAAPVSFDWSSYADIAFSLSATVPTSASLAVDFYGSDLVTVLATAFLPIGELTPSATNPVIFQFSSGTIADLTDVGGLFMTWTTSSSTGPPADTALTIHSIQAVPEPSTWALLLLGAALFGCLAWRRRVLARSR